MDRPDRQLRAVPPLPCSADGPSALSCGWGSRRWCTEVKGGPSLARVITAIVNISCAVDRIPEVGQAVADLDGVSEVYSVAGDVDLVAMVRVRRHEELAEVIAGRLNKVEGITSTQTLIAFQAYSKHDLEATFSLGLED